MPSRSIVPITTDVREVSKERPFLHKGHHRYNSMYKTSLKNRLIKFHEGQDSDAIGKCCMCQGICINLNSTDDISQLNDGGYSTFAAIEIKSSVCCNTKKPALLHISKGGECLTKILNRIKKGQCGFCGEPKAAENIVWIAAFIIVYVCCFFLWILHARANNGSLLENSLHLFLTGMIVLALAMTRMWRKSKLVMISVPIGWADVLYSFI